MTIATFGMEHNARKSDPDGFSENCSRLQVLEIIDGYLPEELKGCIKSMESVRSAWSLSTKVNMTIAFRDMMAEKMEVQVPLMIREMDTFEYIASCIKKRWEMISN